MLKDTLNTWMYHLNIISIFRYCWFFKTRKSLIYGILCYTLHENTTGGIIYLSELRYY
jgi:hypothetical protein